MSEGRKIVVQGVGVGLALLIVLVVTHIAANTPVSVRGTVIAGGDVLARELPLAGVEITVAGDSTVRTIHSDVSGFFNIPIPLTRRLQPGQQFTLEFRLAGYQPLEIQGVSWDKLCVARLTPLPRAEPERTAITVGNVKAKYSISTASMVNIGSAVKTFTVAHTGNTPCKETFPCSPDGRWAAAVGSTSLDAGRGNEFRNARASCIAGPCPFTKVLEPGLSSGGEKLQVSAWNWSDTAIFLLEAEVYKPLVTAALRESYPVVFGQALTFTLPTTAEGVSIQADIDKSTIVFPLGPALYLSWAECQLLVNKDQTRVYHCELKPGYRFS